MRRLEALGYSTMFASDHLYEGYGPITAMATAAMVAPNLHVATAVMGTDFRNPAFLARELASIDRLSEGRLEVGLCAGYQVADYSGPGIPMDEPLRCGVSRLIEHVAVLRGLFAEGEFDFDGEHYKIEGLDVICWALHAGRAADLRRRWGETHVALRRPARRHHRRQHQVAQQRGTVESPTRTRRPIGSTRSSPGSGTRPAIATTT